jgi:acetyl coenzyme A synthetase (ADP forming)-like protein
LRDGSTVHVRPIRPDDEPALIAFLTGLNERSRWLRFFSMWSHFGEFAEKAVEADFVSRYDLVAEAGSPARIVAHAVYVSTEPGRAEVAFAVDDTMQGRGLGTIMLGHLAEAAHENGVGVFEAVTLPENHRMLDVFRESGFPTTVRSNPGEVLVEFPTALGPEAIARFEDRDRTAAAAAMRTLLAPASIAVVGASRRPESIGGAVFRNLITGGFTGPVYPVNPKADVVQSVVAYPNLASVPGSVEVAVIVVPASEVLDAARDCAASGVRGLIVISAGFAEAGAEGAQRQRELLRICREAGMRLIGPNCLGVINTAQDVRMNATFAPVMPPPGRVGFLSQSGALGLAVIDRARALGLGVSSFISNGNKADISGNDLLQWWEGDDDTDLILLYLESFGNPRRFARIARRVARTKPIIAVKSGRSVAGARATSSHTGALLAASDVTVDALFRQAGVIRCDTLAELFDVVGLLAHQPAPAGGRVAIVTNAGGLGILCADACEAEGLQVPQLSEATQAELASFLPAEASFTNPVDMIASASPDDYRRTIEAVARHADADAIVAIFIPPLVTRATDVARAVRAAADDLDGSVPLLTVFMSTEGPPEELGDRIPSYAFPEEAARALARAARYGAWRRRPEGRVPVFELGRREEAAAVIATALGEGGGWLGPDAVARLLDCYGVPLAPYRLVDTPAEAAEAARALGGPVALKAVAPGLLHKTEVRGVRLGLEGDAAVKGAAEQMGTEMTQAGHTLERFLVQRMVPQGVEMLVGVVHDRVFGPVIALGAGGTAVELLKDVSVRITPLTDIDAQEMVDALATKPLLEGYRGAVPTDVPALIELLLRVSAMVEEHSEIAEMDCNPVMALPEGAVVVDARVRVEPAEPSPPLAAARTTR